METLEELLPQPPPWEQCREDWEKLAWGNGLFRALCRAVEEGAVERAVERVEAWAEFAQGPWGGGRWPTVQALVGCAEITSLGGQDAARLPGLLRRLDPEAEAPEPLACQAASLGQGTWWPFLRQRLYELKWQPPLGPEWAWDAISAMGGRPRPVGATQGITVPLVVVNPTSKRRQGVPATLAVELLSDEGRGVLYPDPAAMSFVHRDEGFLQAEQDAAAFVRSEGLWPEGSRGDVRWRLSRQDGGLLVRVEGGSVGGGLALVLAKLLAGE